MLSYNGLRMLDAIAQKFLGAILAVSVMLGSPLHCLAEGIHKPAPGAAVSSRDLDEASHSPKIQCLSHCSSPVALLPFTDIGAFFHLDQVRDGACVEAWKRPVDLFLQTQILVRDVGPPSFAVLARQNLPLLI